MWRDLEGGVYWDELAEICGKISRAAGFRGDTVSLIEEQYGKQTITSCIVLFCVAT